MHIAWDDLQTVEALVRAQGVAAAAKELGVRHTTVSRRVEALECSLGTPLFIRGPRLLPTDLGRELALRAAEMRLHAARAMQLVEGQAREREGRVVVTTSDVLAPLLLAALSSTDVAGRVEVLVTDETRELVPGVVDLALRPSHDPARSLRGRRLGVLRVGIFRARRAPAGWVLPSASLRARASMRWWKSVPEDALARVECNTLLAMRDACVAGLGRAVLPTFLAHGDERLVLEREVDGGTPLWLFASPARDASRASRGLAASLATALRGVSGTWVSR